MQSTTVMPYKMAIVLWPQSNDVTSPYVYCVCDNNYSDW